MHGTTTERRTLLSLFVASAEVLATSIVGPGRSVECPFIATPSGSRFQLPAGLKSLRGCRAPQHIQCTDSIGISHFPCWIGAKRGGKWLLAIEQARLNVMCA